MRKLKLILALFLILIGGGKMWAQAFEAGAVYTLKATGADAYASTNFSNSTFRMSTTAEGFMLNGSAATGWTIQSISSNKFIGISGAWDSSDVENFWDIVAVDGAENTYYIKRHIPQTGDKAGQDYLGWDGINNGDGYYTNKTQAQANAKGKWVITKSTTLTAPGAGEPFAANKFYQLKLATVDKYMTTTVVSSTQDGTDDSPHNTTYAIGDSPEIMMITGSNDMGWAIQSIESGSFVGYIGQYKNNGVGWNVRNNPSKWTIAAVEDEENTYTITRYKTNTNRGIKEENAKLYIDATSPVTWVITEVVVRTGLLAAINNATEKNAPEWQGRDVGYYRDLTSAIDAAQEVYDNATTQEEVDAATEALNTAVANAFIMPEAGKYYYIRSGLQGYYTKQGVYKAMYDNNGNNAWNTLDATDFNYVWTWTPKADGWVVRNVGTGKYLNTVNVMSATEPGGTIKLVYLDAPGEWNIKATGGAVMHTEGHAEGAGVAGSIVQWAGAANTASSWMVIETSLSEIADRLIQEAQDFIDGASVGTSLGQTPQDAINDINAAIVALNGSEKTIEAINTFKSAVAVAKNLSIWPVFTINSAEPNYGIGNSIYEDNPGAQNHFKATDLFDARHFWVFEGLGSNEMAVGTYTIKNVLSGRVLQCSSANAKYTVRHTGNNNDETESGQWLIYPNETSGTSVQVHAQGVGSVVVTWNNTAVNSGSCWTVSYVGTTAEIEAQLEALTKYQTILAKETTAAVISNNFNPAPGYYSEATSGTVASVRAQFTALDRSAWMNIATAALGDLIGAYDAAIAQCSVNVPTTGFYRIKGGTSNNYMASTTTNGRMNIQALSDDNAVQTVWYLDENNKFLSYALGQGIKDTHTLAGVGEAINAWTFEAASQGAPYLNLKSDFSGSKYLCDWTDNIANRMSSGSSDRTHWVVEPVTSLPVTIGTTGYATLYSPVALTVPEGVEAYVASEPGDGIIRLSQVDVVPANQGVILHTDAPTTYDFTIGGTSDETSLLTGTVPTIAGTMGDYVLAKGTINGVSGQVGLFPVREGENMKGFKAFYHPGTNGVRAYGLSFSELETAITAAKRDLREGEIYNIAGQRVQRAANGLYIINGKKVLVK